MPAKTFADWLLLPSTWHGIGGFLLTAGLASAGQVDAVVAAGAAVISAVQFLRRT